MNRERDTELAEKLDTLLRSCVQCGLCLPHCATYLATGNEAMSPRGRLLLLGEMLSGDDSGMGPAALDAFDLCIGCRACETACPSGVPYELLAEAKAMADEAAGPMRGVAARPLASPAVLGILREGASAARGAFGGICGDRWRRRLEDAPAPARRLGRLLNTVPEVPRADAALIGMLDRLSGLSTPPDARPPRAAEAVREAALFTGCASGTLLEAAQLRLRALLAACGVALRIPAGQECCGALDRHLGASGRADARHARNTAALAAAARETGAVIVEAAGCGLELKGYPPEIAEHVVDVSVLLAQMDPPALRGVPLKVVLHDPCHARHGQGIVDEPRLLLDRIPDLSRLEPAEPEVCCGSGGAYSVFHPDLAQEMGRRKARVLAATGADLAVTTNPGCMGQIADGLALEAPDLPILPLSDLLWYAALT